MPGSSRPRRDPTDAWDQLRLLVTSPEQETYELLRPIVLFGQPAAARAYERTTSWHTTAPDLTGQAGEASTADSDRHSRATEKRMRDGF